MTFKHVKFEDSAVMRSLEKVAKEKGLVKEQDVVKTASAQKKADLTPSANLTENLLKLSAGLREAGFSKYADELEVKLVLYKQAQTLYETFKEKGEDLIDAAHPKGGHKLEGIDSAEAVFETILEQHLQNMKVVERKPTGKLAASEDIIGAVKIVLGQSLEEMVKQKMINIINIGNSLIKIFKEFPANNPIDNMGRLLVLGPVLKAAENPDITLNGVKRVQDAIANMKHSLMPKYRPVGKDEVDTTLPHEAWFKAEPLINAMGNFAEEAVKLMQGASNFGNKVSALISRLNSYKSLLNDPDIQPAVRQQGLTWINQATKVLVNYKNQFDGLNAQVKIEEAPRFEQRLQSLTKSVNDFYNQFILGQGAT